MTYTEIKEKKATGDIKVAANVLKISQTNAWNALNRPGSKYHEMVVQIIEKLIVSREKIANENSIS